MPCDRCTATVHSGVDEWVKRGEGTRPRGPFFFFRPRYTAASVTAERDEGERGGGEERIVAHMPEKRERHDKLDLMTVAKKRDMKVGRAGRTDRN